MVRQESDSTPSAIWHIRVTRLLDQVRLALQDISGVCIGEHSADSGCSRTHYHIFYSHDKLVVKDTFTKYFKDTYKLHDLKGQSDFGMSIPTSFHDWYSYVYGGHHIEGDNACSCGKYNKYTENIRDANEILFNQPEINRPYKLLPKLSILSYLTPQNTILDTQIQMVNFKQKEPEKYRKRERCYKLFWNDIQHKFSELPSLSVLEQAFMDWSEGAYELQHVSAPIRYSYRRLCKKFDALDELESFDAQCCQRINSRL